ncbi:MAG: penicillin acylase family protein [Planctomycetes bacterium]|nr:penicillin acylase family protein [Planctomycetota bacterium]
MLTATPRHYSVDGLPFTLRRANGGVVEIGAADEVAFAAGLGYAHAHDRLVQMMLLRLVVQGRLSECLKADEETLKIDLFMREMGFAHGAAAEAGGLAPDARAAAEAYGAGVDACVARRMRPLELLLVGYHPEPWTPADSLAVAQIMGYIGLAQVQQDTEKLIIQALAAGVSVDRLKALYRPHLDGLDAELIEKIKQVRIYRGLVPPEVRFLGVVPALMSSNNWVLAPRRAATGTAWHCNDPHLEVNRLPAIWYEVLGRVGANWRIGITTPGLPALIMGRTQDVSFGFTYGFMDMVDYFLEEVKGGRYRRGAEWREFACRRETIQRKGAAPVELVVRENEHGVLEADGRASGAPPDGIYLTRAWSAERAGAARSLSAMLRLAAARDVPEAQACARDVSISCNWVLADRAGNIGYQQSGLLPARRHSGLHPVPGWDPAWDWQGLVPATKFTAVLNPPAGFLATANDDWNAPDGPLSINLHQGFYRAERVREVLRAKERHTLEDLRALQRDLYSKQAERLLAVLLPLVPDTAAGRLLAGWDLRYDRESCGATVFEMVYAALLREVFGRRLFGLGAWEQIASESALVKLFAWTFDEAMLGEDPAWFGAEGREAVFRRVLRETLERVDATRVKAWGEVQEVRMTNVFFAGKLPAWLGFDHGPIRLEGSRATVVQGGVGRVNGRLTSFCPSWRWITDLATEEAFTALAGGVSGSRLSPLYLSDVRRWLGYGYKRLVAPGRPEA